MKIGYSYHGNTFFEHFKKDVQEMISAGGSYIVQTFSENNMEFNRDNFLKMNTYAKEMGLEVHIDPWSVAGIFGGEAYSKFVPENPDTWQENNYGEKIPLACLNHPKTRNFLKGWADEVSKLNVDYIFWDEPHFWIQVDPSSPVWACRCKVCREKFRNMTGHEMPVEYSSEILQFKHHSIKDFLQEVMDYSIGLGLKNGLCVIPPSRGEDHTEYWQELIDSLPLSYFGTDPYWLGWNRTIEEMVIPLCDKVKDLCQKKGIMSQIWLQGFKVAEDSIEEWVKGIEVLLNSSIDLFGVWSYKCCNSLSYLDFNTSEKLWQILKKKVSDGLCKS